MQLGKLPGRTLAATSAAGPNPSCLFYVTDKNTRTCFLVDTGSEVSAIPPSFSERTHPPDRLTLMAVNDTPIHTYGQRSLTLNLGLRRSLPWIFIIADIQKPILGTDFLRHFGLLVDMQQHKLIDSATHLHIQGVLSSSSSPSPCVYPKHTTNPYLSLLSKFPSLTSICSPSPTTVKHNIKHHIETTDTPTSARP